MISAENMEFTRTWIDHFRDILIPDLPSVLHSHEIDGNGAPQWSPEFRAVLTGADGRGRYGVEDHPATRLRRALKRIRRHSLREYEVLIRVLNSGQPIPEVTAWLNERAIRGGHPERYTDRSTMVILYAAVDKCHEWY